VGESGGQGTETSLRLLPNYPTPHLKEKLEHVHDTVSRLLPEARLVGLGMEGGHHLGEGQGVHASRKPRQNLSSKVQEDCFPKQTSGAGRRESML
jgi:hypothetical protein